MRTLLIHNKGAGSEDHSKESLLAALKLAGLKATYCSTKDDDFSELLKRPAELIVAAGGDGTIAKVLARMPDRSIPIAILPLGTANNIARSLGIVGAPHELTERLDLENFCRFDIGSVRGPWGTRPFVESVGVGVIAEALRKDNDDAEGADRLRKGRRKLLKKLRDAGPLAVDIVIDGKPLVGCFLAVEVLNIAYTGPALPLSPQADPSDGRLEIICVPADRRDEMLSWIESPYESSPPVIKRQGRQIEIAGPAEYRRVDDEIFETGDEKAMISIALECDQAKVLLPPSDRIKT